MLCCAVCTCYQCAGEYGLINGLKRQRTLTAKRDSELLVMQRHRYLSMTETDPRLALLLSRICMVRGLLCCTVLCYAMLRCVLHFKYSAVS